MVYLNKSDVLAIADEAMIGKDDPRIKITEEGTKYHIFMALLAKAMDARRIVELGTYIGETSKSMGIACPLAEVWTVDVNPAAKIAIETEEPIIPNVKSFICHAEYLIEFGHYDGKPVDLLFIDSNHDYSHTMGNWKVWHNLVVPGGIIAIDDWTLDSEMQRVRTEITEKVKDPSFGYDLVEVNKVHATGMAVLIKRR